MRLRSRVTLGPDHDLEERDYEAALALGRALAHAWNARRNSAKIDELGVVVLVPQSSEYEELRRFFLARAKDVSPTWLKWSEVLEGVYSKKELEQSEILELSVDGQAGLGGNAYARVYDASVCEGCGLQTIQRQLRTLVTNLSEVTTDLALTPNVFEVLVSGRLCRVLEDARVEGVELRPVEHAHPSRPARRVYFQLLVHNVIGPLLAPRQVWLKRCPSCGWESDLADKETERPDPWTKIHRWNPGPWDELHFPRASYRGWDLMRTGEMFGGPVSPSEPGPQFARLLISQRLYRLLLQHKITGYKVRPAHLD